MLFRNSVTKSCSVAGRMVEQRESAYELGLFDLKICFELESIFYLPVNQ